MFSRSKALKTIGCLLLLMGVYSLLGFFQGAMLYTGERALKNANLWGSLFLIAMVFSVVCFLNASPRRVILLTRFSVFSWVLACATFAVSIWFVIPVFNDLWAIDRCLDAGGSFNHVQSLCDFSQSHQPMSVASRQGFRIVAAIALVLPAGIFTARCWIARRTAKLTKIANA
jgi:hypothetical protein